MTEVVERRERGQTLAAILAATSLAALACAVVLGLPLTTAVGIVGALYLAGWIVARPTIEWRFVVGALVVVILFIPIRRYRMPGDLPFELEPYRVVVALALAAWMLSLLADTRVRLRRTGFEGPVFLIVTAALLSDMANPGRVGPLTAHTVKSLTFLLSFVLVFFLVATVVRSRRDLDAVIKTLVVGGALVSILAVIESRTGFSPFDHLASFVPVLEQVTGTELERGVRLRAYGPAEHPIALSAALVILVPLALYLTRSAGRLWWIGVAAISLGAISTLSRTGIVMLVAMGIAFLAIKPVETRRLWPLVIPMLVAIHFVLPGALGTFKQAFLPTGGVIAEQKSQAGSCTSAGRVADLGPSLGEAKAKPLFGQGYGTRIVSGVEGVEPNACILDNQWLGTLLETGLLGIVAWLWLFGRFIKRCGGAAKREASELSWLLAGLTASVASFAAGMLLFDAFSFTQATFLMWVLVGLGAATLSLRARAVSPVRPANA